MLSQNDITMTLCIQTLTWWRTNTNPKRFTRGRRSNSATARIYTFKSHKYVEMEVDFKCATIKELQAARPNDFPIERPIGPCIGSRYSAPCQHEPVNLSQHAEIVMDRIDHELVNTMHLDHIVNAQGESPHVGRKQGMVLRDVTDAKDDKPGPWDATAKVESMKSVREALMKLRSHTVKAIVTRSYDHSEAMKLLHRCMGAARMEAVPDGFVLHRQVTKILEDRHRMAAGAMPVNWGMAEVMAYATLVQQGYPVRLTGQDVGVGTFSHRHAAIINQENGEEFIPLQNIGNDQAEFRIYDSVLSEEAVLAFEYGYSTTSPKGLVIWEAQFGDFANGAQVVIDQFIASGEQKWARLSGLIMLLPHGFEGQGPEHSSARLERFLQLCAQHNMQVCIPTTPAQMFHLLRRQAIRPMRRPLIVMSPKWILRHKEATSTLEELSSGGFQAVISENEIESPNVKRLILCSGKVYYHLLEQRRANDIKDIAIVRLEQLYPFPHEELDLVLDSMANLQQVLWCQEEPMNQGAWYSSQHHMRNALTRRDPGLEISFVGRQGSSAPASGYMSAHKEEQMQFVNEALNINID